MYLWSGYGQVIGQVSSSNGNARIEEVPRPGALQTATTNVGRYVAH